jgi:hypothetical protein
MFLNTRKGNLMLAPKPSSELLHAEESTNSVSESMYEDMNSSSSYSTNAGNGSATTTASNSVSFSLGVKSQTGQVQPSSLVSTASSSSLSIKNGQYQLVI